MRDRERIGWVALLASFEGRISRRDFWRGLAAVAGAACALGLLPALVARLPVATTPPMLEQASALAMALLLVPLAALSTKRWHDRNKSGCRSLVVVIPVAGPLYLLHALGCVPGMSGRLSGTGRAGAGRPRRAGVGRGSVGRAAPVRLPALDLVADCDAGGALTDPAAADAARRPLPEPPPRRRRHGTAGAGPAQGRAAGGR